MFCEIRVQYSCIETYSSLLFAFLMCSFRRFIITTTNSEQHLFREAEDQCVRNFLQEEFPNSGINNGSLFTTTIQQRFCDQIREAYVNHTWADDVQALYSIGRFLQRTMPSPWNHSRRNCLAAPGNKSSQITVQTFFHDHNKPCCILGFQSTVCLCFSIDE